MLSTPACSRVPTGSPPWMHPCSHPLLSNACTHVNVNDRAHAPRPSLTAPVCAAPWLIQCAADAAITAPCLVLSVCFFCFFFVLLNVSFKYISRRKQERYRWILRELVTEGPSWPVCRLNDPSSENTCPLSLVDMSISILPAVPFHYITFVYVLFFSTLRMAVQHLQGWTGEYLCLICWNQKQVSSSFCTASQKKRCFKIYTFVYLNRIFVFFHLKRSTWFDIGIKGEKKNPKTTHSVWGGGEFGGKNRALSDLERLTSSWFPDSACRFRSCRVALALFFSMLGSSMLICTQALTQSGWMLYVAYSGESNAPTSHPDNSYH